MKFLLNFQSDALYAKIARIIDMLNLTTAEFLVLFVFAAHIGYVLLAAWLLKATEDTRNRLIDLKDQLIIRSDIEEYQKHYIVASLDHIFSWRFLAGVICGFASRALGIGRIEVTDEDRKFVSDVQVVEFLKLQLIASLAANPFWGLLVLISLSLVSVILIFRLSIFLFREIWLDTLKGLTENGPGIIKFSVSSKE